MRSSIKVAISFATCILLIIVFLVIENRADPSSSGNLMESAEVRDDPLNSLIDKDVEGKIQELLMSRHQEDEFGRKIEDVLEWNDKLAIVVFTESLFRIVEELPAQNVKTSFEVKMLDRVLDNLIFSEDEHDFLSAKYLRDLAASRDAGPAKIQLSQWIVDHFDGMRREGRQFVPGS